MKILNVKFSNINSLKGEWEISFDKYPLADAGLFAITGPNGSGKTSILDSISLALYGETSRLRSPFDSILTRHTSKCWSEVVFSVGDKTYLSRWEAEKNNEPESTPETDFPARMKLVDISDGDKLLEDRMDAVKIMVANISGLDFKRFSRSIMLAQGDFAAFLLAIESDRADILEKITGAEIYTDYTDTVKQQIDERRTRITSLNEELGNIILLDRPELKSVQDRIEELSAAIKEDQKNLETWKEEQGRINSLKLLEDSQDSLLVTQSALSQKKERMAGDIAKLAFSQKAAARMPEIDALNAKQEKVQTLKRSITAVSEELPLLEAKHGEFDEDYQKGTEKIDALVKELEEKKSVFEKVENLDVIITENIKNNSVYIDRIKSLEADNGTAQAEAEEIEMRASYLRGRIADLEEVLKKQTVQGQIKENLEFLQSSLESLEKSRRRRGEIEERLAQTRGDFNEANKEFKKHQKIETRQVKKAKVAEDARNKEEKAALDLLGSRTLGDLEAELGALRLKANFYENLVRLEAEYASSVSRQKKVSKRINISDAALPARKAEFTALEEEFNREKNIKDALENSVQQEMQLNRLQDDRKKLKQDADCPLCGSTNHPYLTHGLPTKGNSRKALDHQNQRLIDIKKRLFKAAPEITRIETQNRQELSAVNTKVAAILSEWEHTTNAMGETLEIGTPKAVKKASKVLRADINRLASTIKKITRQKKSAMGTSYVMHTEKQKLVTAESDYQKSKSNVDSYRKDLAYQESRIKEFDAEEGRAVQDLNALLKQFGTKIPSKGREIKLYQSLEKQSMEFEENFALAQRLRADLEIETKKHTKLQSESEHFNVLIEEYMQTRDKAEKELADVRTEREQAFGQKEPKTEQRRISDEMEVLRKENTLNIKRAQELSTLIAEKKTLLSRQQNSVEVTEKEITQDQETLDANTVADGFANLQEVKHASLSSDEQKEIIEKQQALEDEIQETSAKLQEVEKQVTAGKATPVDSSAMAAAGNKIRELTEKIEALEKELSIEEETIRQQDFLREQQDSRLGELEREQTDLSSKEEELAGIENQGAALFRRKVQVDTLERLIKLSNAHLDRLSGRYSLRRTPEQSLTMEIIDTLFGNTPRPIKTLSGGETFLISLSMALGLSELAGTKTSIESLFLDEGFGTLDEESLYVVLSTLESLQQTGKTIGVISHVGALKDKISTQIQLMRHDGGFSRLKVVA